LPRLGVEQFEIAENGQLAFECTMQKQYDIVLMDCHMPEKNGYEATHAIQEYAAAHNLKCPVIIAMTANALVGEREKCLEAGMDDYLSKPINAQLLKSLMVKWMRLRYPDDPLAMPAVLPDVVVQPVPILEAESDTKSYYDLTELYDLCDNDQQQVAEMLQMFLEQADKSLDVLRAHVVDGECTPWREAAHQFKGGSSSIYAESLRKACEEAQHAENVPAGVRQAMLERIETHYKTVKPLLQAEIDKAA
jgi:CheY-like chemotaxis protein